MPTQLLSPPSASLHISTVWNISMADVVTTHVAITPPSVLSPADNPIQSIVDYYDKTLVDDKISILLAMSIYWSS